MNKWLFRTATMSTLVLLFGISPNLAYAREAAVPSTGILLAGAHIDGWVHTAKASNEITGTDDESFVTLTEDKQKRSASRGSVPSSETDRPMDVQLDENLDSSTYQEDASSSSATDSASASQEDGANHEQADIDSQSNSFLEGVQQEPVANSIGLAGTYYSFMDMSTNEDPQLIQDTISKGAAVASTHPFSATDGNTTYFSGSNPGIFSDFAMNLKVGDLIEIVDENGFTYTYQMNEKIVTDVFGSMIIPGLEKTVMEVYTQGSGEESIVIQYETGTGLIVWYGIPSS